MAPSTAALSLTLALLASAACSTFAQQGNNGNNASTGNNAGAWPAAWNAWPDAAAPKYDYGEALHKSLLFLWVLRSGPLPYQRLAWRSNSCFTCQGDYKEDLQVGFFEAAGSYMKLGLPAAFSMSIMGWGVLEGNRGLTLTNERNETLFSLRHGLNFLLNSYTEGRYVAVLGDTPLDHDFLYYGPPEYYEELAPGGSKRPAFYTTPQDPASEITAEAAAAMAIGSLVFNQTDPAFATKLLNTSKALYAMAKANPRSYMQSASRGLKIHADLYPSSGFKDELVWAALWLNKATGMASYLTDATAGFDDALVAEGYAGYSTFGWDTKGFGIAVLMAQMFPTTPKYLQAATRFFNMYLPGTRTVPHTNNGLAYAYGGWGALRYAVNAGFLGMIHAETISTSNPTYAKAIFNYGIGQINMALGDLGRSYLVGFGNAPKAPFVKAAWNSYIDYPTKGKLIGDQRNDFQDSTGPNKFIAYGALLGGPSDLTGTKYTDSRKEYAFGEPALDYNAGLIAALARVATYYKVKPSSDCGLDLGWGHPNATLANKPKYAADDCYHTCCNGTAAASAYATQAYSPAPANATSLSATAGRRLLGLRSFRV